MPRNARHDLGFVLVANREEFFNRPLWTTFETRAAAVDDPRLRVWDRLTEVPSLDSSRGIDFESPCFGSVHAGARHVTARALVALLDTNTGTVAFSWKSVTPDFGMAMPSAINAAILRTTASACIKFPNAQANSTVCLQLRLGLLRWSPSEPGEALVEARILD